MGNCCTKRKSNEQINPPIIKRIIKITKNDELKYKMQKYKKKKDNNNILALVNGTSGTILIIFMIVSGPAAVSIPVLISSGVLLTSCIIFNNEKKNYEYKLKLCQEELNKRENYLK
tara:strand:- start:806 stop:1153 length:348 start_codon:yes stop_codon:yes gene_type:complete